MICEGAVPDAQSSFVPPAESPWQLTATVQLFDGRFKCKGSRASVDAVTESDCADFTCAPGTEAPLESRTTPSTAHPLPYATGAPEPQHGEI